MANVMCGVSGAHILPFPSLSSYCIFTSFLTLALWNFGTNNNTPFLSFIPGALITGLESQCYQDPVGIGWTKNSSKWVLCWSQLECIFEISMSWQHRHVARYIGNISAFSASWDHSDHRLQLYQYHQQLIFAQTICRLEFSRLRRICGWNGVDVVSGQIPVSGPKLKGLNSIWGWKGMVYILAWNTSSKPRFILSATLATG